MSPIRPLLVLVLLTVAGCVLPEYERPAGERQAIKVSSSTGGADSKGGSSSETGIEPQGFGGGSFGGGSANDGGGNSNGSGGALFVSGGTTGVDVNVTSSGGALSAGGAVVNSGGVTSIVVGTGGGGSDLNSCGGAAGAGGECDCGTGGTNGTNGPTTCPTGYADCLGSGQCDVALARNVDHCGACGKRCDSLAPDSTTKWDCVSGTCIVGQCQKGYADCDGLSSNGCETDTRVDPLHCGACLNSACTYPVCVNSACAPTTTAGRSILPSNPATVPDANLVALPTNRLWFWQTTGLKANDEIVAFGAITNLRDLLVPGTFRMALYDDLNGMPNAPVLTMPTGAALVANDGMQEFTLGEPYRVPVTGRYWVAIWSSGVHKIKIVTANIGVVDSVFGAAADFDLEIWPSGASLGSSLMVVAPREGVTAFLPSIYARYVLGQALVAP